MEMASMAALSSIRSAAISSPCGLSFKEFSSISVLKPELASLKLLKQQSLVGKRTNPNLKYSSAIYADYNGRRGGPGDFVAGFILGGAVFGALGYLLAPLVNKSLSELENQFEEGIPQKQTKFLEDDEGLEKTRKNLNEKIAQLNAAIDNVSAQLRAEEALGGPSETPPEFETAV
ncbi:hypothetical protein O6H91_09G002000 [Diphasiastrum complanatum]|uniref:Uncharacterized protein n=1 Tax=Diphasiastrum complanatum TaxID=34168 RepID=A0ACC2CKU2_DIPCM|nr:hypothetical protein O6H91_09G002000 [Diphasiastrum complanatum]